MGNAMSKLKVVEIASVLAGPAVGMFFAENGAKVVKIENKLSGGDVTRSWKLPNENEAHISAYFCAVNWHKKHLMLDFNNSNDLDLVYAEIKDADILITNFKKGDAAKFGLDHDYLKLLNPNLIIGEIEGFGSDDDRVAYDLILQAESGFMSMNGTEESGPVKMPVAFIDILAAHQLKEGLLIALLNKENGKGAVVSVSLYDAAIASLANQATNWLMANHLAKRIGSLHPNIAPYGELFETGDKKLITFAIGSDKQFKSLCEFLKLAELITDHRFVSNQKRVINREELFKLIKGKINQYQAEDLIRQLRPLSIPVAQIKTIREVFEDDKANSLVLSEEIDGTPTKRVKTAVYRIKNL